MKNAVIYARYSSAGQSEQSIEGQLRVCKEFAERNNYRIVGTYIDRAVSGKTDSREEFQKLIKDSGKKLWEYVVVYKLDRFARNRYDSAVNKATLKRNGVKVLSACEQITDTPEGVILEAMLEGYAEYFSLELSQKVRRGFKESRIKGNFTGGYLIYGYKVENKKVLINENKAEIVRFIFQQYATGTIVKDIIAALTEKGILNRGMPFARNTVYNILKNEKYSGVCHHGEEEYSDIYPQIVPAPIYDIVSKKIEENHYGKRSIEVVYLLREKMICGYCGSHVSAETGTSRSGKVKRYYKCLGRKRGSKCRKSVLRKDVLENLIVDTTCQVLNNPETVNDVADRIIAAHQQRLQDQSVLNILLKEQSDIRKSIANIMAAIEKGVVTNSTKRRLDELEAVQDEIISKLAIERTKLTIRLTKEEIVRYIKTALKKEPKQMIDLLIKRAVLFDDRIEITYNYTDNKNPDGESGNIILHRCSTYVPLAPPSATRLNPNSSELHFSLSVMSSITISPFCSLSFILVCESGLVL